MIHLTVMLMFTSITLIRIINKKFVLTFVAFIIMFEAISQINPVIDSLKNVIHTSNEDTIKIQCLNSICIEYYEHRDYELALQYADSALLLSDEKNYIRGKVNAYINKGLIYSLRNDPNKEIENYKLAISTAEEIGANKGTGEAYINLGMIYRKMGSYTEAFDCFFRSLEIMEELGDKEGIAQANNNLGWSYFMIASYAESLRCYRISLGIYKKINKESGIIGSYLVMGDIYRALQNYTDALNNYNLALTLSKVHGLTMLVAQTRTHIGRVYQLQGKYAEALEILSGTTEIYKELGARGANCQNYLLIGETYYLQKEYAKALKNFQSALRISEDLGDVALSGWINVDLGKLYFDLNDRKNARTYLTEAFSLLKNLGTIDFLNCVKYLAELDAAEGKFENAFKNSMLYSELKDSAFSLQKRNNLTHLEIKYETEIKDQEIELLNKDKKIQEQLLERQRMQRNGVFIITILLVVIGFFSIRSLRLRRKLEKQKAIDEERQRISADLHDDVGSGLSRIMLLSELAKKDAETPGSRKEAEKIAMISHELSSNINEIVWALNSNNDFVENLVAYIRRYASEYFEDSPVNLKIITQGKIVSTPINGERRRNIFYAVKEALNNIMKHAQATEARLIFTVKHSVLSIVINDNGIGINKEELNKFGNGLNNMRNRMKKINGNCIIENNKGAQITLTVPV